jgi:pyrrolidone-carboxylate peptidase
VPNLLVTGFGPFRQFEQNPSWEIAQAVWPNSLELPVCYSHVNKFASNMAKQDYEFILALGVSDKIEAPVFEIYAHNQVGNTKDATGRFLKRKTILAGAPVLGQTLLTPRQIELLPIAKSYSPGDYLCNYVLYSLLAKNPTKRIGFIHVAPKVKASISHQAGLVQDVLRLIPELNFQTGGELFS